MSWATEARAQRPRCDGTPRPSRAPLLSGGVSPFLFGLPSAFVLFFFGGEGGYKGHHQQKHLCFGWGPPKRRPVRVVLPFFGGGFRETTRNDQNQFPQEDNHCFCWGSGRRHELQTSRKCKGPASRRERPVVFRLHTAGTGASCLVLVGI